MLNEKVDGKTDFKVGPIVFVEYEREGGRDGGRDTCIKILTVIILK